MRHDGPNLTDSLGNRIVPRTLLESVTITGQAEVILTLPATPWTRFYIEIDDMAATQDQVTGSIQFVMNGSTRLGASDYAFHIAGAPSNTGGNSDASETNFYIKMTKNDTNYQFGSQNNEAYSFGLTVDPGTDAAHLPKVWGQGMGLSDTAIGNGVGIYGIYTGLTSQEFGRAEGVTFSMAADTIRRGTFRLYGTE
jgi:hypothetical protein